MCKELYHLMNLEELLNTLHPHARKAVEARLFAYEEEIDDLEREVSDLDVAANQYADDIERLEAEINYLKEQLNENTL